MEGRVYVSRLIESLFEKDTRRLEHQRNGLIEENWSLGGPREGFLFGGRFHSYLEPRYHSKVEKKLLNFALHPAGRDYLNECDIVDKERQRLNQGLAVLLAPCTTAQDVRDALPDVAVSLLPDLTQLPRLKEEGWTFRDKPLQQHDFQTTVHLLNFYVANRILY